MASQAFQWIDSPGGLAHLAEALATASEVALDTESNAMHAYRERLCLVQIGVLAPEGQPDALAVFAIDPLGFASVAAAVAPLVDWMTDPAHRVLLHGGEYDVSILKRETGHGPARVYDTQAAAAMLGVQKTGYASLVEAEFGVHLGKAYQKHDWARRPIPEPALRYALDDVHYLPGLVRAIEARVRAADLEEEVAIACQTVAESRPHAPRPGDQLWRAASGARLGEAQLGMLAALIAWRETAAEKRDKPAPMWLPSEVLRNLAAAMPTSSEGLRQAGVPRSIVESFGTSLLAALAGPPGVVPPRPERVIPDPVIEKREVRLKRWRETEAAARKVTTQAVLPARALEYLAAHPSCDLAEVPQFGAGRTARYGTALRALVTDRR